MAHGYSDDLRVRVIDSIEGGATRREAARQFRIGASSAIRWMQQWSQTGDFSAKGKKKPPRSPLAHHRRWLLDLVAREPDVTLEEAAARLEQERGLKASASAISRFYGREGISFKKNRTRERAGAP